MDGSRQAVARQSEGRCRTSRIFQSAAPNQAARGIVKGFVFDLFSGQKYFGRLEVIGSGLGQGVERADAAPPGYHRSLLPRKWWLP